MKSKKLQNALQKLNSVDTEKKSDFELISTDEAFKVVGGLRGLEVEAAVDCNSWGGSCGNWGGSCGSWN